MYILVVSIQNSNMYEIIKSDFNFFEAVLKSREMLNVRGKEKVLIYIISKT